MVSRANTCHVSCLYYPKKLLAVKRFRQKKIEKKKNDDKEQKYSRTFIYIAQNAKKQTNSCPLLGVKSIG